MITQFNGNVGQRVQITALSHKTASWYTPIIYTRKVRAIHLALSMYDPVDTYPLYLGLMSVDENLDVNSVFYWTDLFKFIPMFGAVSPGALMSHNIQIGPELSDVDDDTTRFYARRAALPPMFRLKFYHYPGIHYDYSASLNFIA